MNRGREMETQTKVYSAIREETNGDEVMGGSKGRKIKCPCREKHETIKMGKKIQRGKEGMSCNRERRGKGDKEREKEGTEGIGG